MIQTDNKSMDSPIVYQYNLTLRSLDHIIQLERMSKQNSIHRMTQAESMESMCYIAEMWSWLSNRSANVEMKHFPERLRQLTISKFHSQVIKRGVT